MVTQDTDYLEVERHHTRVCPECKEVVFLEKNDPAPENRKAAHPWHFGNGELSEAEFHRYVAMAFEKGIIKASHKAVLLNESKDTVSG